MIIPLLSSMYLTSFPFYFHKRSTLSFQMMSKVVYIPSLAAICLPPPDLVQYLQVSRSE